ncbi:sensor histidine kinase [Arenibaculum sp.]|uniref:sensor histidine kinase n=1 Tax=Arenibaculum sp. TaxID=2865862 RepID=UPI002E0F3D09|nr:histidine kinase dimerization/phosphoacceptor domain -containing protein [Arenibaculum sp.]
MAGSLDGGGGRAVRRSRLRDHLRMALIASIAVLGGLAAVLAWRGYHLTFERHLARTEADVALMARDIERLVHSADLLLVQMVDLARETDWDDPDARVGAGAELRHLRALLPESFRLHLFDARGDVRATSIEGPVDLNVAGRGYFGRHRDGKSGLHISGLLRDLHDTTPMFTMSRRVPDAAGGFDGVAAVSFEPGIVGSTYSGHALAEGTTFIWAHADGRVILREPGRPGGPDPGETLAPDVVAVLEPAAAGYGLRAVLPDRVRHLVKVRRVGAYPYYAIVGTPVAGVVDAWIDGLLPYVLGGGVALLALALGARRWLAWAAVEDRYRERLALLLTEKDTLLDQKELLIREIDHRVKNSLQLVGNLLDLQAGLTRNATVRAQLAEARGRVEAVALLHRSLQRGEGSDGVELAEYLDHLVRGLAEATRAPVEFVCGAPAARLSNDAALSVGLVVNELVTNALKHAYPATGSVTGGPVRVLLRDEGGGLTLRIADAGTGLPPGFDVHAEGNLGMRIVRMLVDALGGKLRAESLEPGTAFEIVLPHEAANHSAPAAPKLTTTSSSRAAQ